jgi:hypothetical protein
MSTDYNPDGRKDNCGFCAIAHGLHLQKASVLLTADQLYDQTLQRLNLEREGGNDPIPRQLIFPEATWSSVAVRANYSALSERTRALSDYTITAVAEASGLRFRNGNLDLVRDFMKDFSTIGSHPSSLKDFVQARWNYLQSQGKNPKIQSVERYVTGELVGHSIMGSKSKGHFINAEIDPSGAVKGFDAQDGSRYDGKGLLQRLNSVDLFMRL